MFPARAGKGRSIIYLYDGENEDQHCIFPSQTSNRFSEVQAGRGGSVQPLRHRQAGRRGSHRAEYLPWLHSLPGDIYTVLEHVAQQSVEPGRQQEHHRRIFMLESN